MANQQYLFSMEGGFSLITSPILPERKDMVFSGKSLLAITADDYTDVNVLNDAKRLMRLAFAPLLKYKPLRSRELFLRHKKNEGID